MTASVVVSIDRTSLSLSALTMSSDYGATSLVVTSYTAPSFQRRNVYTPDKDWLNGSVQTAAPLQQDMLGFSVEPTMGGTETDANTSVAALQAALGQFNYTITVTVNGVALTYTCDSGQLVASQRTQADLRYKNPSWAVTVPCYPVGS